MRTTILTLLVLVVAGCSSTGGWYSNQREQVIQADAERNQARIDEDWDALAKFLAKEFVYHMATGVIADKKTYLAAQQAEGSLKFLSSVPKEASARVYEGAAVNRGISTIEIETGGEKQTISLRYLNVWIWRDGRWQLAARQSSIEKPTEADSN